MCRGGNFVIALKGYSAYFDASYDQGITDVSTVVAGYVATVDSWIDWELAWQAALDEFHVPYFHMKKFIANRGAFSAPEWKSEQYRKRFISRLVEITKGHIIATVGALTWQSVFDQQNQFFELDQRYNPYVLCGRDCAVQVHSFIREQLKSDLPIAFVFERGDDGWGMLVKEMEASGLPSPIRKHARPDPAIDDPPALELQACDLLAWEIRRGRQDSKSRKKLRGSLQALAEVKYRLWHESEPDDLVRLIRKAGIPLRPAWRHL